jgi:hypothetical protein
MKTVLIIDDDSQYRQLMGEILQFHGWRVLEAGEATIAWRGAAAVAGRSGGATRVDPSCARFLRPLERDLRKLSVSGIGEGVGALKRGATLRLREVRNVLVCGSLSAEDSESRLVFEF